MIPVLSGKVVREVDGVTMQKQRISALELMERAGAACAGRLLEWWAEGVFGTASGFHVLVGMGNNGGDGLVIARWLAERSVPVRVTMIHHCGQASSEQATNVAELIKAGVSPEHIRDPATRIQFEKEEVIIDCLLGTGSNRPLSGLLAEVVKQVNAAKGRVVAIDLPTGLLEGGVANPADLCVQAERTLTFEVPRPALLLDGTGGQAGEWELIHIGLDREAIHSAERSGEWIEEGDVRALMRHRPRSGHKGTFGHALLIAGSTGFHGAAMLAARGCSRSGVGLFTVHGTSETLHGFGTALPDAMTSVDTGSSAISSVPDLHRFNAVGIGPGLGTREVTTEMLKDVLTRCKAGLVLDADALNIMASHRELLKLIPRDAMLTPHPKEMDRLLGKTPATAYERLMLTRSFAKDHACHIVLKGAYTAICGHDDRVCYNSTGNVGMAKGGSGDVLTGLLTGLLAQGYAPMDACLLGVHLHGLAGDLAAKVLGSDAMRPSDLVDYLPPAWKQLRGR